MSWYRSVPQPRLFFRLDRFQLRLSIPRFCLPATSPNPSPFRSRLAASLWAEHPERRPKRKNTETQRDTRVTISWSPSLLRPYRALIFLADGLETFIQEPLHALTAIRFGCVDVALRIRRDAVDGIELSGLPTAVAKARQGFQRITQQNVDLLIRSIDEVDVLLLRILRKGDIPYRTVTQSSLLDELFLHIRSIFLEHLNPIVHAIAYIKEAVVGQ